MTTREGPASAPTGLRARKEGQMAPSTTTQLPETMGQAARLAQAFFAQADSGRDASVHAVTVWIQTTTTEVPFTRETAAMWAELSA